MAHSANCSNQRPSPTPHRVEPHWGRYLDEYRVVDGEWRFAQRRVLVDALSPHSIFAVPQE